MRRYTLILAIMMCTAIAAGTGEALAAADGSLGAVSVGTTEVSLTIPERFRISNMQDMQLGTFSGGSLGASADLCIYTNGDGSYQVSITDTSSASGFNLQNGGEAIAMQVSWNNAAGAAGGQSVGYANPIVGTSADTSNQDCSSGMNANLSVDVDSLDMENAQPGYYSTTLAVMVEPD